MSLWSHHPDQQYILPLFHHVSRKICSIPSGRPSKGESRIQRANEEANVIGSIYCEIQTFTQLVQQDAEGDATPALFPAHRDVLGPSDRGVGRACKPPTVFDASLQATNQYFQRCCQYVGNGPGQRRDHDRLLGLSVIHWLAFAAAFTHPER
jgi:hypothetical protein